MPGIYTDYSRQLSTTGAWHLLFSPFAAQCEVGNVRLLAGRWNEAFLDEMCMFPNGAKDDQVDSASGSFDKPTIRRQFLEGVSSATLRKGFPTACESLGLDHIAMLTIHHGRQTFISHALAGHRTLAEVRNAAGHAIM